MQVTIVKDGDQLLVGVNGEHYSMACPSDLLPASFHALQWDGASGEMEHRMMVCDHCGGRNKKPNEPISDLSPYQPLLDTWRVTKTAVDLAKAEVEKTANAAG